MEGRQADEIGGGGVGALMLLLHAAACAACRLGAQSSSAKIHLNANERIAGPHPAEE